LPQRNAVDLPVIVITATLGKLLSFQKVAAHQLAGDLRGALILLLKDQGSFLREIGTPQGNAIDTLMRLCKRSVSALYEKPIVVGENLNPHDRH
jgi:hypothetical protein